jgi:hypothetical protein
MGKFHEGIFHCGIVFAACAVTPTEARGKVTIPILFDGKEAVESCQPAGVAGDGNDTAGNAADMGKDCSHIKTLTELVNNVKFSF